MRYTPTLSPTLLRRLGLACLGLAALPAAGWSQAPPPPGYGPDEKPDEPGAIWAPAAPVNFAAANRPVDRPVDMVIIHDIEGPADFAVRWFQNPMSKVSSHYVIGEDGTVWQQVKEHDVAWHAGNSAVNGRAVGIEHAGYAYRPGFFNRDLYESSARLVRSITARYGIPRDRTHIIAHAEVPSPVDPTKFGGRSGHTDPGPYWDWEYYMALVRNDARVAAVQAPEVIRPGEKLSASVTVTNAGDDPWPFYNAQEKASELRALGPVYLAAETGQPLPARVRSPLYDAASWISPRMVAAAAEKADTAPGATATFHFTLLGPRETGTLNETFRLVKFPPAPRQPVPFGQSIPLRVKVEPWRLELDTATSQFSAPGWKPMEREGHGVFTRKWEKRGETPEPARWTAQLPIDGEWDVYSRWSGKGGLSRRAVYEVTTADGPRRVEMNQRKKSRGWEFLGRFKFSGAKPVAVVTLAGEGGGTVEADALRFVGPVQSTPQDPRGAPWE